MKWLRNLPLLATAGVLVALLVSASILYEGFASTRTVSNLLGDNATLGIVACGMTLVILAGGIDLSVGAVISFSTVLLAVLIQTHGMHPFAAIPIALILGTIFGAANGAVIHFFKLPAFLVTLAGMFFARGMAFALSSESIGISHPFYNYATEFSLPLFVNAQLSAGALLWMVLFTVITIIVHYTPLGRDVYALGGNENAAQLMGVPIARTRIFVYSANGFCAALAGVAATLFTGSGNPTSGFGMELDAIASVVIGGTLLTGGFGTMAGTALGVLIFGTIQMAIVFDGRLNSWYQRIAVGALLLIFILAQSALSNRKQTVNTC
jgi:simple sugar transport system permease protein